MGMICPRCGQETTPGSFCDDCGAWQGRTADPVPCLPLPVPSSVDTPMAWEKTIDLLLGMLLAICGSTFFVLGVMVVQVFFHTTLLTMGVIGVSVPLSGLLARFVYRYWKGVFAR